MICRVCLEFAQDSFNIFDVSDEIATIIGKHFWFEPKINDSMSDMICQICWKEIEHFHKFYIKIDEAHKNWSNFKIKEDNTTDNIKLEFSVEEQVVGNLSEKSCSSIDINMSYDDDNSNDNKVDEKPAIAFANTELELSSSDLNPIKLEIDDTKQESYLKNKPLSPSTKKTRNLIRALKRPSRSMFLNNEEIDKKIASFMTLSCDICKEVLPNLAELKLHFKKIHNTIGYIICCNKKFTQNQFLVGHIDAHLNPDNYKCSECNQILSTKKNYEKHMQKKHVNKIWYNCNDCPRKFDAKTLLERHQPIHWPKEQWTVKCSYCTRCYPSQHFLNNHVIDIHEKKNICQICGKSFSARKFREHQRSHLDDSHSSTRVQCDICAAWLKSKNGLRTHMKNHQEASQTHVCNICGKVSPNKGALKIHIKNHEASKSHQCAVCGKGFKRPLALRQHMATHTGEFLYQCKYCSKTFIYDSAFHTHKKREHPEEYEKEKKKVQRTDFTKFSNPNEQQSECNDEHEQQNELGI